MPEPVPDVLAGHGAVVRTRRGQTLPLSIDASEAVFVVRSGALMLHLTVPQGLRQVVSVLQPGDVFRGAFAPQAASAHLTAVSRGEVLRFRWSAFRDFAASTPAVQRYYDDRTAQQTALQAIHTTAIGRFDCQQRVATFLTELALRTGARAPNGGLAFEMPLSRTDMADYLGLNADTLSRTMSRLRASGLLSHPERHRALVRDFEALAALSPAAASLRALCGDDALRKTS
ncbi:MAG TPA: Crp/Fnr family transcriptional regulator [Methyloceanibacter sp.]|nr:Crp/Fnr family transcriptional regulator [Methyloceanibacter sp.]